MNGFVDIVFDGPPSHESGRFVEVEDPNGRSVSIGEWIEQQGDPDGWHRLRIPREASALSYNDRLTLVIRELDKNGGLSTLNSDYKVSAAVRILNALGLGKEDDRWRSSTT